MELIKNGMCKLCEEHTATLAPESFSAAVENGIASFYKKKEINIKLVEPESKDFCAVCTHKILLASKFKDSYEQSFQSQQTIQKNRNTCMFCRVKATDVLKTEDNPNNFKKKVKAFMDVTLFPRPFLQSGVCCSCLFHLSLWCEMNVCLKKKIHFVAKPDKSIETSSMEVEGSEIVVSDDTHETSDLDSGKENITPPQSLNRSASKTKVNKLTLKKKFTRSSTTKNDDDNTDDEKGLGTSKTLRDHLKLVLQHLVPLKQMHSYKLSRDITSDEHFFNYIPYVLVSGPPSQSKQINNDNKIVQNNTEVARRTTRTNRNAVPTQNYQKVTDRSKKTPAKSKLPIKNSSRIIRQTRRKIKQRNYKTMHTSGVIEISDTESDRCTYTCSTCDKVFNVHCDYKQHKLWHEKPQNVIINVIKQDLPVYTQASKFKQATSKQISHRKLSSIIQKYIDFSDEEGESNNLDDTLGRLEFISESSDTEISNNNGKNDKPTSDMEITSSSNGKPNPGKIIINSIHKLTDATESTSRNTKDAEENSSKGNENGNISEVSNNSKNGNESDENIEENSSIQKDESINSITNVSQITNNSKHDNDVNEENLEETDSAQKDEDINSISNVSEITNNSKHDDENSQENLEEKGSAQKDESMNSNSNVPQVTNSNKNNIHNDSDEENTEEISSSKNIDSNNHISDDESVNNTEAISNEKDDENNSRNGIDNQEVTNTNDEDVNTDVEEEQTKGLQSKKESGNISDSNKNTDAIPTKEATTNLAPSDSVDVANNVENNKEDVASAEEKAALKSGDSTNPDEDESSSDIGENKLRERLVVSPHAITEPNTECEMSAMRDIITSANLNNEGEGNKKKRKRSSPVLDSDSDTSLTPKSKRVRFAVNPEPSKVSDDEISLIAVLEG